MTCKQLKTTHFKKNHGRIGIEPNHPKSYVIINSRTKETLQYFRTIEAAKHFVKIWEKKEFDSCEVVKL